MKSSKTFLLKNKLILVISILTFISCADYFYAELYSAFYPETSNRPVASESFFYTNYYPYGSAMYDFDANAGQDSVNIDSWETYTHKKISREQLWNGFYKNDQNLKKVLLQNGYKEAAIYFTDLLAADKILFSAPQKDYWDPPVPIDTASILALYPQLEQKINNCKETFIQERYIYLLLKLSFAIEDYNQTIRFFNTYTPVIKSKTFITEKSRCYFAGALYHTGDHARSFYEFAQLFNTSSTQRTEAGHSIIVYNIPYSNEVLKFCKSETEKAHVYAMAAVVPQGDGLGMIKKIYQVDPKHLMLEHLIAREINKNEELLYHVKLGDDSYSPSLNSLNQTNIPELLSFTKQVAGEQHGKSSEFWNLACSYLFYITGDYTNAKKYLKDVADTSSNEYIGKQKRVLSVLINLQSETLYDEQSFAAIYTDIESLLIFDQARDMSVIKLISLKLSDYFRQKHLRHGAKPSGSFFSGCGKSKNNKEAADSSDFVRIFFAQSLDNISGVYEEDGANYKLGGYERQLYLDSMPTQLLGQVVQFMDDKNINPLDKILIELSAVTDNEVYLAYGRRLMLDYRFEEALEIYKKIDKDFMDRIISQVDFRAGPELYLKSFEYDEIPDYLAYIENIVQIKKATESRPTDAEAWFKLGTMLMNISYNGKAWILSKSARSSAEIESFSWGGPESRGKLRSAEGKNYYGNSEAIACFEKALMHCSDKELCARSSYLGAKAEENKFWVQYYENLPDYEQQEAYHSGQLKMQQEKFQTFFRTLFEKYSETKYENLILEECDTYRQYVN